MPSAQVFWQTESIFCVISEDSSCCTAALVASAPTQILNPKLILHLDLIIQGLEQSVSMVEDTGTILSEIVA